MTNKEKITEKFSEASFEEGYAIARKIYEPVIVQTLNINGDVVTQKINNKNI